MIIGLILLKLYEYHILQSISRNYPHDLNDGIGKVFKVMIFMFFHITYE